MKVFTAAFQQILNTYLCLKASFQITYEEKLVSGKKKKIETVEGKQLDELNRVILQRIK